MANVKLLLDLVQDLNALASTVQAIADSLEQNGKIPIPSEKKEKTYEIEDLRAVLANKVVKEAHELLLKYEARKLSELPKEKYSDFMAEALQLTDKETGDAT